MQEAPSAHKAFARVFAIDDVVDRPEIGFAVAVAAFRRGILPRGGLRVLDALGRRRMRGEEILCTRIERGLADLQRRVALHRGEEARRAVGIEMRARREADADTVGLELLLAREARHRQFGFCQGQRGQIGIVAHVGDDACHYRRLPRLVFPDRGVLGQHMRHLVAEHRGQLGSVAGERDQAARDVELAGRQREGIHRAGIEDRHLVGLVGTIGRRDQAVDSLADQRLQFRVVVGAAIGRQDALMLALARRRLRHRAIRSLPAPSLTTEMRSRGGPCCRRRKASGRRTARRAQPKGGGRSFPLAVPRAQSRPLLLVVRRENKSDWIKSAP